MTPDVAERLDRIEDALRRIEVALSDLGAVLVALGSPVVETADDPVAAGFRAYRKRRAS